ncbi:hypothetical protein HW450_03660 [Corynebacterium hindlerae]|uniref:Uncharacterized protein n=1 Tax=Corynebacterium hindlerae TaxID=699041 RepID=A0A7G5FGV0_9CORY|nr:hypothetical protein [Corynebacterium hindlerae]QMV85841.1 hypothetical protein HW450_03660 [Corynebacterium hindlerae]
MLIEGDVVFAGTSSRIVPVADDYAEIVADAAVGDPDAFLVCPGRMARDVRSRLSNWLAELGEDTSAVPSLRRLRTTRIIELIQQGLADELISAVTGIARLDCYASYRPKYSRSDVIAAASLIAGKPTKLRAV